MLFFLLLLQTAPNDPDPAAKPAFPRILDVAARDCGEGECDPGRRYRLNVREMGGQDAKDRALRGEWQPCATTGAPVCPTKPQPLVHID